MKTLIVLAAIVGLACGQNFFANLFGGGRPARPPQRRPPQQFRPRPRPQPNAFQPQPQQNFRPQPQPQPQEQVRAVAPEPTTVDLSPQPPPANSASSSRFNCPTDGIHGSS